MNVEILQIVLAFAAGLLVGSFLNVCVYRLPRDLSVAKPARSFCPGCEKTIAWYDNIPVLSFFLLRARCRNCGQRIPWRYPLVELFTGLAFALCVGTFGLTLQGLKFCLFSMILIDLIATDFEERILPDEFTLGGTLAGLVLAWFVPLPMEFANFLFPSVTHPQWLSILESALGAGLVSGIIWALGWVYNKVRNRDGLGFGDVKMIAMIGAFLGLKLVLLTVILGSLIGSIGGLAFIWLARKQAATYELPFGSFLGVAALIVGLWGEIAAVWYSGLAP
jgi:leader peptidase (prepilin peptidase) / N-methyltransferase